MLRRCINLFVALHRRRKLQQIRYNDGWEPLVYILILVTEWAQVYLWAAVALRVTRKLWSGLGRLRYRLYTGSWERRKRER